MIFWIVFLLAVFLMAVFHEVGHRVVWNREFLGYEVFYWKGIWIGFVTKINAAGVSPFEYLNGLLAGFCFSLVFPVLFFVFRYFAFGELLVVMAVLLAVGDFLVYYYGLLVIGSHHIGLHQRFGSVDGVIGGGLLK
jgi:hypothetical protein